MTPGGEQRTVLVVDDHPVVRRGVVAMLTLQPWVARVVEAGTAADGVATAVAESPDAAVVDLGLPDGDGVGLVRRIKNARPDCAIVVLTMTRDAATVTACLEAGANGYLLKDSAADALVGALRTALDGGVVLGPAVGGDVLEKVRRDVPPPFDVLTPRELRIVALLGSGLSTVDIAKRLGITEKTVRNQLAGTLPKLGVEDRVQAALLARDAGLTSP